MTTNQAYTVHCSCLLELTCPYFAKYDPFPKISPDRMCITSDGECNDARKEVSSSIFSSGRCSLGASFSWTCKVGDECLESPPVDLETPSLLGRISPVRTKVPRYSASHPRRTTRFMHRMRPSLTPARDKITKQETVPGGCKLFKALRLIDLDHVIFRLLPLFTQSQSGGEGEDKSRPVSLL